MNRLLVDSTCLSCTMAVFAADVDLKEESEQPWLGSLLGIIIFNCKFQTVADILLEVRACIDSSSLLADLWVV